MPRIKEARNKLKENRKNTNKEETMGEYNVDFIFGIKYDN
jgi:hypothetical protein